MGQEGKSFQPDHAEARNSARFWMDGKHPERPKSAFEFTNLSACYLELSDALKVVHAVRYASQPYVHFFCTGEPHYAGGAKKILEGVFEMEEGGYTFEVEEAITCADCLNKLRQRPLERFGRWLAEHPGTSHEVKYGEDHGDPTTVTLYLVRGEGDICKTGKDLEDAFDQILKELDKRLEEACARIEAKVKAKKQEG